MGKTLSVDTQGLDEAVTRLSELSKSYASIARQLMERAETMGSAWDAPDNLAYVAQIQGLKDDLQNMSDKLQFDSELLASQSNRYKGKVEDNTVQVKKLTN